jgi:hypothetical protein
MPNLDIKIKSLLKCVTVKIFGSDSNKSKFDSGENWVDIEFWLCLVPFFPQNFSSAVRKCKNLNIQDYNFDSGSVCKWNFVFDIKGGTQTEVILEWIAERNIWNEVGWSDGRVEKTAK